MSKAPVISAADLDAIVAEGCKRRFFWFLKEFWYEVVSEKPVYNWHIEYLCDELQKVGERVKAGLPKEFDYFIINIPPGSSKSTIISIMYPLWCWVIDPKQRFICASYSATISEDLAEKARRVFVSAKYKRYFPHVGVVSEAITKLQNACKGERYTTSTTGSATGLHADQKIIDDPMNPLQASSDVERLKANKFVISALKTRNVNALVTVTILVMQRLHEEDTTGVLLAKKSLRIKRVCLPAELPPELKGDSDGKQPEVVPAELRQFYVNGLLDPVRMPLSVLEENKETLGSYDYAGQYQQTPADYEGGILKREWFEIVDMDTYGHVKNFAVDTAYTEDEENDPSGCLTYFKKDNCLYITNWETVRKEFPDYCKYLVSHVKNSGYGKSSRVRVEPKATGKSVVQTLRKATMLNIIEGTPPTKDKKARAMGLSQRCETRRVKLLRGAWNKAFLDGLCMFPRAAHDEEMDCLAIAMDNDLPVQTDRQKTFRRLASMLG